MLTLALILAVVLVLAAAAYIPFIRRKLATDRVLALYRRILPDMSQTEKEAIDAGTVWWDGDLFSGRPDFDKLLAVPEPRLSAEEQAFLDGPVEELCAMCNDWEITHELQDLPARVWQFIKDKGFLGMIIPKKYGGLGFSALAHSAVVMKLSTRSSAAAISVMVPNSLGPAELLLHYGTDEQKDHYLPRLANGLEIPCFALTNPEAGSDAASIPDYGIVCKGTWQGKEVLGMRVTWDKRYITLGPVATLLGLAFRLYDPEKLISEKEDLGITCALVPTHTPGVNIGRRHLPLNAVFQNGPNSGKGICLGPNNWIGRGYQMTPIAITVEGANILTRTLIIFGQGAIRCHPYVLREMRAAKEMQGAEASREFDAAFTSHIGHVISNGIRAFAFGLVPSLAPLPKKGAPETRHYYRHVSRLSAAFAFLADISMMAMGGALKRKEKISGRLGDILSMMYLASATLKRYEDQGRLREDLPLVRWSVRDALYHAQLAFDQILSNFPSKTLATLLRVALFPRGMPFRPPLDSRNHECARIALEPGSARDRLTAGMYLPRGEADATGILESAFVATVACEPIDKKLRDAVKQGSLKPRPGADLVTMARDAGIVTAEEYALWQRKEALRKSVIRVDDFPQDFGRAEIVEKLEKQAAKAKAA